MRWDAFSVQPLAARRATAKNRRLDETAGRRAPTIHPLVTPRHGGFSWQPKAAPALTLRDRLSRLNYTTARELLGPERRKLIQQGGAWEIDIPRQVHLGDDLFRVRFFDDRKTVASITLMAGVRNRLNFNCTSCDTLCEHIGAAVSLVLEEKMALGLSDVPPDDLPSELSARSSSFAGPSTSAASGPARKRWSCARRIPSSPGPTTR